MLGYALVRLYLIQYLSRSIGANGNKENHHEKLLFGNVDFLFTIRIWPRRRWDSIPQTQAKISRRNIYTNVRLFVPCVRHNDDRRWRRRRPYRLAASLANACNRSTRAKENDTYIYAGVWYLCTNTHRRSVCTSIDWVLSYACIRRTVDFAI